MRNKIAVQRLTFLGLFSTDHVTRERYADCTIGNRSLNEIALAEIGVRNGKITFNLTDLYKKKANLSPEARIVIEQRNHIRFSLTKSELMPILVDGKHGKELKTLYLYAVDMMGNIYSGKIRSVRSLLAELLAEEQKAAEEASMTGAGTGGSAGDVSAADVSAVDAGASAAVGAANAEATSASVESFSAQKEAQDTAQAEGQSEVQDEAKDAALVSAAPAETAEENAAAKAGEQPAQETFAAQTDGLYGASADGAEAQTWAPVPAPDSEELAPQLPADEVKKVAPAEK